MAATHEDRNANLSPGVAIKAPCRVATTVAITLSGEQTIDGVACVAGNRVLVKNQANSVDNGIWGISTGAWSREPDFDGNRDVVKGTFVFITDGTVNAGGFYECTTTGTVVFGTSNITFAQGALGPIALPLNLSNTTFTQAGTGATARIGLDKTRDIVSVKDFGAVGDGVTDDTAVIQAAINSIAIGGVGRLHFPSGTYLLSAQLIASGRRWIFEGDGTLGTKLLWNGATNTAAVKFTSDAGGTGNTYFAIKTLSIINNVAKGTTQGLLLTSAQLSSNAGQALLEQVFINGFNDNLAIGESAGNACSEVNLIGVVCSNGTNGIKTDAANTLNINAFGCSLSGNTTGWLAVSPNSHAIHIYGGSASANTSVDFDFESAGFFSIQNFRSENSGRFVISAGTSAFTSLRLASNISVGSNLNTDNADVKANQGNFTLIAENNLFRGNFDLNSSTGEGSAMLAGNTTQQATLMTTNGDVNYRHFGNYQVNASGLLVARFPDRIGSQRGGVVSDATVHNWVAGVPTVQHAAVVYLATDGLAAQSVAGIFAGNGAPNNANGSNGDFYFRGDGTQAGNTVIYHKQAGAWVALITT